MNDDTAVALVTGSRRGLGRFLCEHLLGRGYRVVGCSREAADWESEGFDHQQVDVTDEAQVEALLRRIRRSYGRLDAAINNAAIASMNHVFLTPGASVEKMMATNVLGTFLVSREAAKIMRRKKFGRIVNVSSVAVPMRLAGQAVYNSSKSAVEKLSQTMARELAEYGITVNVVGPGPIDTDMIRGIPQEKIDSLVSSLPVQRLTSFNDVGNVVDFFLRAESAAITGQVVYLSGVSGT